LFGGNFTYFEEFISQYQWQLITHSWRLIKSLIIITQRNDCNNVWLSSLIFLRKSTNHWYNVWNSSDYHHTFFCGIQQITDIMFELGVIVITFFFAKINKWLKKEWYLQQNDWGESLLMKITLFSVVCWFLQRKKWGQSLLFQTLYEWFVEFRKKMSDDNHSFRRKNHSLKKNLSENNVAGRLSVMHWLSLTATFSSFGFGKRFCENLALTNHWYFSFFANRWKNSKKQPSNYQSQK